MERKAKGAMDDPRKKTECVNVSSDNNIMMDEVSMHNVNVHSYVRYDPYEIEINDVHVDVTLELMGSYTTIRYSC